MEWLERKYINLISSSLRNFKWKKGNLANCSCPICGDSKTNKLKARFFFMTRNGRYHVFCHNCGASRKFTSFLKEFNHDLYNQYTVELITEQGKKPVKNQEVTEQKVTIISDNPLSKLKRVNQYPSTHIVKKYCDSRFIPPLQQSRLYYAPEFMDWTNSIIPDKFKFTQDESRLVIPMLWTDGTMFAYQGRALDANSKIRYITITLDYSKPKLFGLEKLNMHEDYFVMEGPIDSLFIDNSIAMAGSDVADNQFINEHAIFVLDNEPRNKEVVKKYEKIIRKGHRIVIWPDNIHKKDINEMVINGKSPKDLRKLLLENTLHDLEALLKFNNWKKV